MKKLIKKLLKIRPFDVQHEEFNRVKFAWAKNPEFNELFKTACEKTGSDIYEPHKMRCYNTLQFLKSAPEGEIAEVGTYKGTLAYLMRNAVKKPIHVFDSFEGLSGRWPQDSIKWGDVGTEKGGIACSLEQVKENLKDFPDIKYYKGWVPERFNEIKNLKFSFVYIDVDVYQPTKDSFDFFYPKMVKGGIIMCDDYGFNAWPGAKKAVEEMSVKHGFKVIELSTAQCVVLK